MGRFGLVNPPAGGIVPDGDVAVVVLSGTTSTELGTAIQSTIQAQAALQTPRNLADIDLTGGSDDSRWFAYLVFDAAAPPIPNQGTGAADLAVRTVFGAERAALQSAWDATLANIAGANEAIQFCGWSGAGQGHQVFGYVISTRITP